MERQIRRLHFECHWMHRKEIAPLRQYFGKLGVTLKLKIGVETFDSLFRESYLDKGIGTDSPAEIASYFDEACCRGFQGRQPKAWDRISRLGLHGICTVNKSNPRICQKLRRNGKAFWHPNPKKKECPCKNPCRG